MIRVAYISADPGVPVFGQKGCSIHVQEVIRALRIAGASVELFAARLGGDAPADLSDLVIHPLPAVPKGDTASRELAAFRANEALGEVLRASGPFDLVYERYSIWSCAGMEYARDHEIPGLLEVNAPLIEEQATHRELIDRDGAVAASLRAFKSASAILAVSQEVADYLRRVPLPEDRLFVVPNGVNPARFADCASTRRKSRNSFAVGFVGTLKPWHGTELLLHAFAELHRLQENSELIIVGDGPQRLPLEELARSLGIHEVTQFTGAVRPEEIPAYLSIMDVAVAPYPELANFYFSPLKVYEYMAAALPVVASDIGQIRGVLRTNVNGLLVPAGNTGELAAALLCLKRDAGLRERLGCAALETVHKHHTWISVAERILSIAASVKSATAAAVDEML